MFLSTVQMFYRRKKLNDIRDIVSFLQTFNAAFDRDTARSMYEWSSMKPYVAFFSSVCVCITAIAVADRCYIPCPELTFTSLFITSVSFMALNDKYEHLVLASIVLNLFASIPAMSETIPNVPFISSILKPVFGYVVSFDIPIVYFGNLHLNIGLPSFAYLIVPILFVAMAMKRSGHGMYYILVPHLVCFSWWQTTLVFYRYSTWYGLIRASVGWLLLILMLPLLIVVALCYVTFYTIYYFGATDFLRLVITILLITIPAGITYWMRNGFSLGLYSINRENLTGKLMLCIIVVLCAVPLLFLCYPRSIEEPNMNRLTWDKYYKYCSTPAWADTNMVDVMLRCAPLRNFKVNWTGIYTGQSVIKDVSSSARAFLDVLSPYFANLLERVYGIPYGDCNHLISDWDRDICELALDQGKKFHLTNLDQYTFQFNLIMPNDQQIRVEASHYFKDILRSLRKDDQLHIRGLLADGLGGSSPLVRLQYVDCFTCSPRLCSGKDHILAESKYVLYRLRPGLMEIWNFFFAPVLQFDKIEEVSGKHEH